MLAIRVLARNQQLVPCLVSGYSFAGSGYRRGRELVDNRGTTDHSVPMQTEPMPQQAALQSLVLTIGRL